MRTLMSLVVFLAIGGLLIGCSTDTSPGEVKKLNGEMTSDKTGQVPSDVSKEELGVMGPKGGKSHGTK